MKENKECLEWINKAEEDFGFASLNLSDPAATYYAQICFHFQQAAEKYLKAFIIAHKLQFKKIHDLPELLRICAEKDPQLIILSEACEYLTDYYVDTRYPVHWPSSISRKEAGKAKTAVEQIKNEILKKISA
jgi:HEPN domain-containing protein